MIRGWSFVVPILGTVGLLLAPIGLAWQMLPSWLAPARSGQATYVLVRGFIPPDAEGARGVLVYALEDGGIVNVGRTTRVGADAIAAVVDPGSRLDPAARALWLPRDLATLWAGREQQIAAALDRRLARIAVAIEQTIAQLIAEPAFRRRHLPKLQSLIEQALAADAVVAAQRRASAAVRNRFVGEVLPVLEVVAFDAARQAIDRAMSDPVGELGAALRGRSGHLSLEAMLARIADDERLALATEVMVLELARDPAVVAYAEAVAAASAEVMATETADISMATIWSDPDLQPLARQLTAEMENELREIIALLIFTPARTAIDPIAAVVLRGLLSDRHRYFVLLVPAGAPAESYAGLEQRAFGILVAAPVAQ